MPKYKLMVARFPYGGSEATETVDWLIKAAVELAKDPRFDVVYDTIADTPITMTRNLMFDRAQKQGVDLFLCIDSDMAPDLYVGREPDARPFLKSAIDFMLDHDGPCVVAAPYCGPPPIENIYVFTWGDQSSDHPNSDTRLLQYTREQAALMTGIRECAALPTGLMLIDMRALKKIKPPYTYYEHSDDRQLDKASTEDVTLTRDLSLAGVPVYCAWDSWAGHIKRKIVGKPRPVTSEQVADRMHHAITNRVRGGEKLREIKSDRFAADIARAEAEAARVGPVPVAPRPPTIAEMEDFVHSLRGSSSSVSAATAPAQPPVTPFEVQQTLLGGDLIVHPAG